MITLLQTVTHNTTCHIIADSTVSTLIMYLYTTFTLHYTSGPNRAEPNRAGPAVQTMLAWFGPAHFSSVL